MEEGSARLGVILDPRTEGPFPPEGTQPDRAFFDDLSAEVTDKGFLVTSTAELFQWARTGSLWWMTFALACCAVALIHLQMPSYYLGRFGRARRVTALPLQIL